MNGPTCAFARGNLALRLLLAITATFAFLVPLDARFPSVAGATACSAANLTVTPLSDSIFYADFSPSPPSLPTLAGHYTGYKITNNTGAAIGSPWLKLSSFSGGVVSLASGEASAQPLGTMASGGSGLGYFSLTASSATSTAQTHTVSVYDRNPSLTGATELCNTTFTFTSVTATTQASANKVTVATATSNPPGLGATMTMTVQGDTGTIGNGPAADPKGWDMTPAAVASGTSAWTPGAFRLTGVNLNIDLDGTGAKNWPDYLHRTFTDSSSSSRSYTITYTFIIVGTTSANTPVTPIQYIASGTQIKHTDMSGGGYSTIQPIQPISNTTTLAKSVSPAALTTPGGTVTYTVTATNSSSSQSATLDDFTDTPGSGGAYVAGSSKYDGVAISDPLASGSSLVWPGAWSVPAGTSRSLTYDVAITSGVGTVTNSVIGHVGSTVIDTTTSTSDNSPATSTVTVAAAPTLALAKSVGTRVDSSDQFTVAIVNGATTVASGTTSGSGTTASTGSQTLTSGTTYTLTDAMAGGSASTIGQYTADISCGNTNGSSTTTLPSGTGSSFTVTPLAGDVISCTFSNTAGPRLTLTKSVASRADANDQFTVAVTHGATTDASATTSGSGTSASTTSTSLTDGTTYTLTDAMAAGSPSVLGQYASAISCTNSKAGSSTALPSGSGTSWTVTPASGDVISCTVTNTAGTTGLGLTKSASPNSGVAAGAVITYTYGVTNTGALPLTNVTVTDPMSGLSTIGCTPAQGSTLAAGATMSCTATYTVTQTDVDAGSIVNTGTATGTDPSANTVTQTAGATVTAAQSASFALSKSASPSSGVVAGDTVNYTISGSNDGSVTLHDVSVNDPLVGSISCTPSTPATLAPTATISCTGSHVVTQAEVDAGSFLNTATISGLDPSNTPVSTTASTTVTASQTATVSITKTASPSSNVVAGDTVTYTFSGENTGVVTLHGATVTDPMSGLSAISCTPSAPTTLAPGDTISCTATYTVTQAEVDTGSFSNTATMSALDPGNNSVTGQGTATVTANQSPGLALTKSATPSSGVVAGDVVTYTYTGENTGTVTVSDVTVTDPMADLSAIACAPAAPATLAPGATISCTATYTVTQADVDGGSIVNTASITGTPPSGPDVSDTAGETVTADQTPGISLTKVASPNSGVVAGDVVLYTLTGTNTGAVTLTDVDVTDPMSGLSALSCAPSNGILAPGDAIVCTGNYSVTQADVDAGTIVNTASADGTPPSGPDVSDTAGATVTAFQDRGLSLAKTASPSSGVVAGDTITYTLTGENTGTVSLVDVVVSDPMSGLSAISCTPAAPAALAPGDTIDCTATYTVTQADVDAGQVVNTATISGEDGNGVPTSQTASATATASQSYGMDLTKTASPASGVVVGDVVTYTYTATNTGAVSIHDVTVTDPMVGLSALACTPSAPAVLASGESLTCTATYTVTQADFDAGSIVNTATVDGLRPDGNPVTATGGATVTVAATGALSLTKTASPSSGVVAGDVITYTLTGENTGAVPLTGVTVTDAMTGLSAISCIPTAPATLAPGDAMTCTATYTATQADVDAGSITNTASVTGDDPDGAPTTASGSATVTTDSTATIALTKTATPATNLDAGDVVTYTMTATNTGAVSLHQVTVTDPMPGLSAIGCTPTAPATLEAGDTMTCAATYTVTQTDVDAGSIVNTATASGLDPANSPIAGSASATVAANQVEELSLVKTATPASGVGAGDVVTYTMTTRNTGTITVEHVTIADTMPDLSALDCAPAQGASLAPGASMTCTATYTVTQADADAGRIDNTATVSGDSMSGHPATNASTAIVATTTGADVDLTKELASNVSGVATWVITVTNTGTGPYPGPFTVTDPLPDGLAFESATGDGWACTGTSTVSCTHAGALPVGDAASVTVVTDVTGTGAITNTATMDVAGTEVEAAAEVTGPTTGGFAFTGSEAERFGLVGLLLVLAGWFVALASRRRHDEGPTA